MTDRPLRPWEIRRERERAAMRAEGHACLTRAARALPGLTDAERAEAERLIALPYGAEGHALRQFILDHHPQTRAALCA